MTNEEQDAVLQKEQDRQIELLLKLSQLEEFRIWRDIVCKPQVQYIEDKLVKAEELSEIELRATLKHLHSLKYYFHAIFDQVASQINKQ